MRTAFVISLILFEACASSTPVRPVVSEPGRVPTTGQTARCAAIADSADHAREARVDKGDTLRPASVGGTLRSRRYPDYDVVLDVPLVCAGRIALKVDTLKTKLGLDTRVANLVRINAGADVIMGNVDVSISGVQGKALLLIDLTNVAHVVDRTLAFVDSNPGRAAATRGLSVVPAPDSTRRLVLLGMVRSSTGEPVERLINVANGDILERSLAQPGQALVERTVGNVAGLPAIDQATVATGMVRTRVRDASGIVLSFVSDERGKAADVQVEKP
jgi:hypothetical protein